jgi:hypothetical protein
MKVAHDDSDCSSDSSSESSNESEEDMVGDPPTKLTSILKCPPLPDVSSEDNDDDDDDTESTVSEGSLLGEKNPVSAVQEQEDWQFDLGVLKNQQKKRDGEEQANQVSTTTDLYNTKENSMPMVTVLSEELSVISIELEESNIAMKKLVDSKENEIKEFRRNPAKRRSEAPHNTDTTKLSGTKFDAVYEQRKKERAERLARARERIAREKAKALEQEKEEELRRKAEEAKAVELDMSDEGKRDRVYQWYSRCGQPKREELKRRIAGLQTTEGIDPDDVDLLPWNFNGTAVNVAKMMKYQNMVGTN